MALKVLFPACSQACTIAPRGRQFRLGAVAAINTLAMCHTITRLFEDARPIDVVTLIVEVSVFALILFEVISGIIHRRQEHQRRLFINERVLELSRMADKGGRIRSIVPDPSLTSDYQILARWMNAANEWIKDTDAFLLPLSAHASAAFLLIADAGTMDSVVYSGGRQFALHGEIRECYQRLVVHLENLRRITEIPEAYF
jgi:hypothetical protein